MCRLFETIRIEGGKAQNLALHETRMNNARKFLLGCTDKIKLADFITPPEIQETEIIRCRIDYSGEIESVVYSLYKPAIINSLKVVIADEIDYRFKYSDRSALTNLIDKNIADDILIVRKGQVTDTSYSNIAFTDGKKWYTPSNPLLKGTMREKLINQGILTEMEITRAKICSFSHFRLINAMLGFDAPILQVSAIVL